MPEIDLKEIVEQIQRADSPLLNKTLTYEWNFRQQTADEIKTLLESIAKIEKEEPEVLQQKVLSKLKVDASITGELNERLKTYSPLYTPSDNYLALQCPYPLKYKKDHFAIANGITFVQDLQKFSSLCEGILPTGYGTSTHQYDITILSNDTPSLFGNHKGTVLKTAAITTYLACTGIARLQAACDGVHFPASWIDHSAMLHVTHMPTALYQGIPSFDQFTYAFGDTRTPSGLAFVHNGFTYGGPRSEHNRYLQGKPFAPEDCSSFQAKMTASTCISTTADHLCFYRAKLNEGTVPPAWLSGPEFSSLDAICEPVKIKTPDQDIKPGDILSFRRGCDQAPLGKSGHTGIVLGFERSGKDSNALVLAADRDIENTGIEGVGIQRIPLYEDEGRKVMLFRPKPTATRTVSTSPTLTSLKKPGTSPSS